MRKFTYTLPLSALFFLSSLVWAQDYSLILLPTLGGKATRAFAISENGQITGTSDTPTFPRTFLWSRTGGLQDLGPASGAEGSGQAINASGQVAGYEDICFCQANAFVWSATTGLQNIGSNVFSSVALGMNNSFQVVGSYQLSDLTSSGFLWTEANGMQDLGTLGCANCFPNAINDSGQVTGWLILPDGSHHGFLWAQGDGVKDLGTLGGPNSAPTAINGAGQIVGTSDTASGFQHAFSWTSTSGMQDLGTLPGKNYSSASAVDAAGRVVGSSWNPGKNSGLPFSWTQAEGMTEIGPFPGHHVALSSADGVNLAGQVLLSKYTSGEYLSYLATPLMYTTLTSSPNPSLVGQAVTFTASVGSAVHSPPPDGEIVTFMYGANILGTALLEGGVATITVTMQGSHRVRAAYAGDANYSPSKSATIEQVVEK